MAGIVRRLVVTGHSYSDTGLTAACNTVPLVDAVARRVGARPPVAVAEAPAGDEMPETLVANQDVAIKPLLRHAVTAPASSLSGNAGVVEERESNFEGLKRFMSSVSSVNVVPSPVRVPGEVVRSVFVKAEGLTQGFGRHRVVNYAMGRVVDLGLRQLSAAACFSRGFNQLATVMSSALPAGTESWQVGLFTLAATLGVLAVTALLAVQVALAALSVLAFVSLLAFLVTLAATTAMIAGGGNADKVGKLIGQEVASLGKGSEVAPEHTQNLFSGICHMICRMSERVFS